MFLFYYLIIIILKSLIIISRKLHYIEPRFIKKNQTAFISVSWSSNHHTTKLYKKLLTFIEFPLYKSFSFTECL